MWKHILEGITGPVVEELMAQAKGQRRWRSILLECGVLLGFAATTSWLTR